MKIRMVATDIDGTLTERRGVLLLSIEAVEAIRRLERGGIRVSLVSGNSVPVVAGLARYLGAAGPSIAENGCVLFYSGEIIHLCKGRPDNKLIEEIRSLGFRESWQNTFRFHDIAFMALPGEVTLDMVEEAIQIAKNRGFKVLWSGYAIHIQPPGGGKYTGVVEASRILGVDPSNVAVVGDGQNDLDMFREPFFKACPGDADPEVKKVADYIASLPGGKGFREIAEKILSESN